MKIVTWNVNGIRAAAKKGLLEWIKKENADIICLQETKAFPADLPEELRNPEDYHALWHSGTRKGYAGTLILSKEEPLSSKSDFDIKEFHEDGRVTQVEFKDFFLLNIYFPNGGTRADGTEMLSYKLNFYDLMIDYVNKLRDSGKSVILTGDFNIAHTEIDIARPKENANSIGFLPVERKKLGELMDNGYTDVFRHFNPKKVEYTWWSYRMRARDRNVGWRLDYFLVTKDLLPKIQKVYHGHNVYGSDHCPVTIELDL